QEANLKVGGDYFFSRDETGTNISPYTNLLVNADGSLTPFTLPNPDERQAWSVDAWLKVGPFDLIGEYLDERVRPCTTPGVAQSFFPNDLALKGESRSNPGWCRKILRTRRGNRLNTAIRF